ncbi:MAG TPA: hypothetical protein VIK60_13535, partial [Vicinamibacterales bacterium]
MIVFGGDNVRLTVGSTNFRLPVQDPVVPEVLVSVHTEHPNTVVGGVQADAEVVRVAISAVDDIGFESRPTPALLTIATPELSARTNNDGPAAIVRSGLGNRGSIPLKS